MENRFGFKDFVVLTLLAAVIVIVALAMVQYDRQWDRILQINTKLDEITQGQSRLERELGATRSELDKLSRQGVMISPGVPSSAASGGDKGLDPFARLKTARSMPDYAQGDWVIDAFGANVAKITPLVSVDVYGAVIQGHVIDSLAGRDPETLEYLPVLSTSWIINDNTAAWQKYVDTRQSAPLTREEVVKEPGYPKEKADAQNAYIDSRLKEGRRIEDIVEEPGCPEATTITFQMRRGVAFSDGHPLTSEDVVFTYDLIMNEKLDAPREREQARDLIKSVNAGGPFEVTFKFKKPYFESFGVAAGMGVLPKHFYSKYTPEQINSMPGLLMGSGPYRMETPTDWSPGKLLALVRNERYWGVPPAFDRVIYREVNQDTARLTMFRNGEIDLFGAQPEQYVKMIKDEALMARVHHFEFERITGGYGFIAWNQKRKGEPTPFADKRVRQAMTMMIDRQRLFDELLLGFGIPVTGPFNRLNKQCDTTIKPWPFDVARAKSLLKEAGFKEGADGTMIDANGKPFRFKVLFPSQTNFWDRVLLMLKDNLAKAGVTLELDALEWSVFDARVKARDFDALCMAWGGGIESDVWQMFHSSQIANEADNFTSYSNPELDKLLDRARRTVDEEKRMPLWRECHRILAEDQPYTFLYSRKSLSFLDKRLQNVQRVKLGLNDRDEWFVPKSQQLRGKQ